MLLLEDSVEVLVHIDSDSVVLEVVLVHKIMPQ